eukprot:2490776-Amphidinium_carterae.1
MALLSSVEAKAAGLLISCMHEGHELVARVQPYFTLPTKTLLTKSRVYQHALQQVVFIRRWHHEPIGRQGRGDERCNT